MQLLILLALALSPSPSPEHLASAQIAAIVYHVDADVLLAIAEHETTWDSTLRNGWACGAMQVVPTDENGRWSRERCEAMAVPLISYLEGAAALRERLRFAGGNMRRALRLYGCGWAKDEAGNIIRPAQIPATCKGFDGYVLGHAKRRKSLAST